MSEVVGGGPERAGCGVVELSEQGDHYAIVVPIVIGRDDVRYVPRLGPPRPVIS